MNDTCESIIIKGRWPRRLIRAFASGLFACLVSFATAATFVVSSPVDNAVAPNLRRAISDANANPGLDVIVFNFTVYPATLTFSTPLPDITESVVIDGTDSGDAFAAGLIYGKLAGWSFELAGALGAFAATAVGA